ncbi:MAG: hypothetical protein ACFE94_13955 [Candidatus Hodarchaeota archaeon]
MRKELLKWISFFLNLFILVVAFTLLLLNINTISVIHAQASESLPVLKYETYSSIEISIFYIIIMLVVTNIVFLQSSKLKRVRPYILSLTPIISIIYVILPIFNPHSIIINPTGWPPTKLDGLEIGAIFSILLFVLLIFNSILILYIEGFMKKYLYTLVVLIVALLISDFLHESGHAFFILISGGKITEFYPFPVLLGGEFNAGYVGFANVPSNLVPLIMLGGEIFQWLVICILTIVLFLKPQNRINFFITFLLIISFLDFPLYTINNSIGLPHWFLIGSTEGDIIKFSSLTGIPMWIMIILASIQLIIGALIIYFLIIKKNIVTKKEKI